MVKIYKDIEREINRFLVKPRYKLREWIDIRNLDWADDDMLDFLSTCVCRNTPYNGPLKDFPELVVWYTLSGNSNDAAIELLKQNPDKINWRILSGNQSDDSIELLKQNPDKIDWSWLSQNTNNKAIELLRENPDKINWVIELL